MKELGPASAEEMVLEFLRAEAESPRFGERCRGLIQQTGFSEAQLLRYAELKDARQNAARAEVLGGYRGYGHNAALFAGMPVDTLWTRVEVTPSELSEFRYANHEVWLRLTLGSRRVADGARNLGRVQTGEETLENVEGIVARIQKGETFAPLVAVSAGQVPVLVEGHTRATAYVRVQRPESIVVLLGETPRMAGWAFF